MTKFSLLIVLSLISYSFANGQKKTKSIPEPKKVETTATQNLDSTISNDEKYFIQYLTRKQTISTRWNDFEVTKDALYDLILRYPENDSLLLSLATIYYENGKYPSSILVCNDLLARSPKNIAALELSGLSYENLNIYDKALQNFESHFLITNNSQVLYKMAFLQLKLKRYQEVINNTDILLSRKDADTVKIVFNDSQNIPKEYPMKVALLNLKGVVYKEQSDFVNAKKFFKEALAVAPDFQLAKDGISEIEKPPK